MNKLPLLLTASLLCLASQVDAATILYQTTPIGSSARFSDSDSGFRTHDAFSLVLGGAVERVVWSGFWIDLGAPVPAAAPVPDVADWDVAFYADNGGQPGAIVSTQTVAAAAVQATFLGTGGYSVGQTFNVSYYQYTLDLPLAVGLASGTPYWLSIYATGGVAPQNFAWRGATGGDGTSLQTPGGTVSADRHFALEGTAVPEPGTLWLLGSAGLAYGLARRRAAAGR